MSSRRALRPSLPMPIALTARSTFLFATNSTKQVSWVDMSVRVATLKISAPHDLAARAMARKLAAAGVDLKSCTEMMRPTFFRPARSSKA